MPQMPENLVIHFFFLKLHFPPQSTHWTFKSTFFDIYIWRENVLFLLQYVYAFV